MDNNDVDYPFSKLPFRCIVLLDDIDMAGGHREGLGGEINVSMGAANRENHADNQYYVDDDRSEERRVGKECPV